MSVARYLSKFAALLNSSGQVPASALQPEAQYMGFKNRIINGAMGIWQRGTSGFTTNGNYGADRWMMQIGGTASTVAQSTDAPSGFKYSFNLSGTGSYPTFTQRIEAANCVDLVGASVTVSFWAKQTVSAGTNSLYAQLFYANAADNFSSTTQIGSTSTFNGTGGWVQYTTTFTNLPSSVVNGIQLNIGSFTASGATTFYITGVQLEKGSTATSFDYRPYGTELALCQRYFYKPSPTGTTGFDIFAFSESATQVTFFGKFPTTLRATPTVTVSGPLSLNQNFAGYSVQTSAQFATQCSVNGIAGYSNTFTGLTTARLYEVDGNAGSGNYVTFSAEL